MNVSDRTLLNLLWVLIIVQTLNIAASLTLLFL